MCYVSLVWRQRVNHRPKVLLFLLGLLLPLPECHHQVAPLRLTHDLPGPPLLGTLALCHPDPPPSGTLHLKLDLHLSMAPPEQNAGMQVRKLYG